MSEETKLAQLAVIVVLSGVASWYAFRTFTTPQSRTVVMVRLLALIVFVVGTGIGAGSYFASFFPPIFAVIATGVLTFFGLLVYGIRGTPDARIEDRDLRVSIAASVTVMYLVLVGYGVFVVGGKADSAPDPIALPLMNSFTAIVGTVIAFYFGATAYIDGKRPSGSDMTKGENPTA